MAYSDLIKATSGLVGYWRFEEAGATVADETGNGRTVTLSGTASLVAGISQQARYLSGNAQYDTSSNLPLPYFTVEVWFKPAGVQGAGGQQPAIVTDVFNSAVGSNVNYTIKMVGGSLQVYAGVYDNTAFSWHETGSMFLTDGAWNHIVFYHGPDAGGPGVGGGQLFVNNVAGPSAYYIWSGTAPANGPGLRFGRRWDATEYVTGVIDEVAIYNRPLTGPEIASHYNAGISPGGAYKDLVGTAAGRATNSGVLSRRRRLTGAAVGAAVTGATVTRRRSLSASALGRAITTATPTRRRGLTGLSVGRATASGVVSKVGAVATGEVSWGSASFRLDHSGVPVGWSAGSFRASAAPYVDWDETSKRFALTP